MKPTQNPSGIKNSSLQEYIQPTIDGFALGHSVTTSAVSNFHAQFIDSLHHVSADEWNGIAGSAYPFLRYEFLLALEESQCTSAETGWQPHHLLLYSTEQRNELVGLLPLYSKTNSYGEYVFDWSWADAYQQHGLDYYPKLISAIPFTPSAGPRLAVKETASYQSLLRFALSALQTEVISSGASGAHILFPEEELSNMLEAFDYKKRVGCQYQWFNNAYPNFDGFLASFTSRKRKNIRKERQKVIDAGISFRQLRSNDINLKHWQQFFLFYQSTYFVRGQKPYLNLDFFLRLGQSMSEQLLLVIAYKNEEPIAGALSFIGSDTLYGRYWGCTEAYQFLHFETCYYQGIDYCIQHQLSRFDSGAQGEHKIQRGFVPVPTWSNHWLAHAEFHGAIDRFLQEEGKHIQRYIQHAEDYLPFKSSDANE